MVTFDTVREMALALDGVEDGTSYGTPALKWKKKLMVLARMSRATKRQIGDVIRMAWRHAILGAGPKPRRRIE